jgi:pimeloyl-ACP methyl ester carboxylesterase
VLLLVHGSSLSSRSSFDLTVPEHGEYSVMNVFAGFGFDVWTLDHENYGRSSRTEGNSDIASGVEDLKAAVELIVAETGRPKLHIFGESSGGLRAGAYAMARPERVDRLIFVPSPTRARARRRSPSAPSRSNSTRRTIGACATAR